MASFKSVRRQIVLIRTTGLWGSDFLERFWDIRLRFHKPFGMGARTSAQNFLFFTPRRKVTIEIETNPDDFPRDAQRVDFNRYLENWYNRYRDEKGNVNESEPIKLVSYSFWRKELPTVFKPKKRKRREGDVAINDETRVKIYAEIRRILNNPALEIRPEMSFPFDLGMDSLTDGRIDGLSDQKL